MKGYLLISCTFGPGPDEMNPVLLASGLLETNRIVRLKCFLITTPLAHELLNGNMPARPCMLAVKDGSLPYFYFKNPNFFKNASALSLACSCIAGSGLGQPWSPKEVGVNKWPTPS